MNEVKILFHGNLQDLLNRPDLEKGGISHSFDRKASIKDVIESLGVPHPEIDRLLVDGREVSFDYILQDRDEVEVYPLTPPFDVHSPSILRPEPLEDIRFVVDVNVGKLAVFLRMCGFDTFYQNGLPDRKIAEVSMSEKRILLTKDIHLLKRKRITFGHLVRETNPKKQLSEVIRLFGLANKIAPFTRCLDCNHVLVRVDKGRILHRLKPLTRKYYDNFHTCIHCDKIYWQGSHRENMEKELTAVLDGLQ